MSVIYDELNFYLNKDAASSSSGNVVDDLTSTSGTDALSANQGRALGESVTNSENAIATINQTNTTQGNDITAEQAKSRHMIYKVALIDTTAYMTAQALGAAYNGLVAGTAAIAVTGGGGPMGGITGIYEVDGQGGAVELTVLFNGLTINDNSDDGFKKWDGSAWIVVSSASATSEINRPYHTQDAPILLLFGQSNAGGHGTSGNTLSSCANVFGLNRANNNNQNENVTWTNYESSNHCLGNDYSNTFNSATEFARLWQNHIDSGNANNLPNLYVIHVAWGSQGIDDTESGGNNRWYIDRDSADVESLFHLAKRKIRGAVSELTSRELNPRIIGLDWNQWETEAWSLEQNDPSMVFRYREFFTSLFEYTNKNLNPFSATSVPVFLHKPLSSIYDATSTAIVTGVLDDLVNHNANISYIDPSANYPNYDATDTVNSGIFTDGVHYTGEVHTWFAQEIWNKIFTDLNYGVSVPTLDSAGVNISDVTGLQTQLDSKAGAALEQSILSWYAYSQFEQTDLPVPAGMLEVDSATASNYRISVTTQDDAGTEIGKTFRFNVENQTDEYKFYPLRAVPHDSFYGKFTFVVRGSWAIGACFRWRPDGASTDLNAVRTGFKGLGRYLAFVPFDYTNNYSNGSMTVWAMKNAPESISLGTPTTALPSDRDTSFYEVVMEFIPDSNGTMRLSARPEGSSGAFTVYHEVTGVNDHSAVTSETNLRDKANGGSGGYAGLLFGLGVTNSANDAYGVPRYKSIVYTPI